MKDKDYIPQPIIRFSKVGTMYYTNCVGFFQIIVFPSTVIINGQDFNQTNDIVLNLN